MVYEIRSTAEFGACLDEAVAFRVNNYGLRSARRLLDAVDEAGELLADTPFVGALVDSEFVATSTNLLRRIRIDSYIAVYRVCDELRAVNLLKLFYGSFNWRKWVLSI